MRRPNYTLILIFFVLITILYFCYLYFLKQSEQDLVLVEKKQYIEDKNLDVEEKSIIHNIVPNQKISSPLLIRGQARGTWFFEGSFPIKLLDQNYKEIVVTTAQAKNDWMTEDFVNFESILEFKKLNAQRGFVLFQKDNPSGLTENDEKIYIPIVFN
ncbi:MAG TPA: Gmad2 immunoglobulin-like domain-containing protein [bacterium]|nr:Gmad2 immunoglobulin-like domain-containing protein [bacterium]